MKAAMCTATTHLLVWSLAMDPRRAAGSRVILCVITTIAVIGANGCALTAPQKAAIGQFGLAASNLGDVTSAQLVAMREDTIKMNMERLVLGGASKDPRLADETSLDKGFELKTIQTVVGATNALGSYGKALTALATNTQAAALKTASDHLVASLGGLPGISDSVSTKQLSAIGSAVQDVGGIFIEWKRKEAVRTIVSSSSPAVDKLCDLLVRDFSPGGWVETQLLIVETTLSGEASNAFKERKSFPDRRTAVDAFRLAYEGNLRREQVVTQIADAAQAMKKANAKLADVVEHDEFSIDDIREFAARAARLRATVDVLIGK